MSNSGFDLKLVITGVSSPVIIQKAKVKLNNLTQAMDYLNRRRE